MLWQLSCSAAVLYFFLDILRYLTPGAPRRSRWMLAFLLCSAPAFGYATSSDTTFLPVFALCAAALCCAAHAFEYRNVSAHLLAAVLLGATVGAMPPLFFLLVPLCTGLMSRWWRLRKLLQLITVVALFVVACVLSSQLPLWREAAHNTFLLLQNLSLTNYWGRQHIFEGKLHTFLLPNLLYALSPLCYPAFFLLLPPLFLLFKKTDLYLSSKKLLATGALLYALVLAALPVQQMEFLLPLWFVLLILLFPAFDRFVSYGFYFFPRLAWVLCMLAVVVQLLANWFWWLRT